MAVMVVAILVAVTVLVGVQHWLVEEGTSLCRLSQLEDKVSERMMGIPTIMMVRHRCHPCRSRRTRRCSTFVGQRRDQLVSLSQLEDKMSERTMGVPTIMMMRHRCHPCCSRRTRRCSMFVGQRRDQLVSFKSARRQGE